MRRSIPAVPECEGLDRVFLEVENARAYFRKRRLPTVDVTNKPIEASAREVVSRVTRRLGVENVPGHEL